MHGFDRFEQDDAGVVFRDLITLALCGFIVCVVLMLPHINAARAAKTEDGAKAPGNVVVEVTWPPELDTDIDLWVQGPGDIPVGYSNKGGGLFNLLRDDLGHVLDVSGLNYEVAYSRGVQPGEYVVNVHLYRNLEAPYPLGATVVASVKRKVGESAVQLVTTKVALGREGQELTAFRFRLDEQGNLVPGSVNSLFRELRAWKKPA